MSLLDQIGLKYKTDQSSAGHNYLALFELLFANIYARPEQRILEIGIQFGNSLRTWKEYFECPTIYGVDSVDNNVKIDGVGILIGDAYDVEMLHKINAEWDVIIDDGSHVPKDQCFVVKEYPYLLSKEGVLIIEDIASLETCEYLKGSVPEGFNWAIIDMRGLPDSILFLIYRK